MRALSPRNLPGTTLHWTDEMLSHNTSPSLPNPNPELPRYPEGLQKEATYIKITGNITITKFLTILDRASCC